MKMWLGGTDGGGKLRLALAQAGGVQPLVSFHRANLGSLEKQNKVTPDHGGLFLDSGAYSAWSLGAQIDLDEYCAFIRAHTERVEVYACLDSIPGKLGQSVVTPRERDEAAELSWKNYLYMCNEGLDPLPVYHYGENVRFLERMLAHGCTYIGIGGLVGVPSKQRQAWLDLVFARLTDAHGLPIVRTHGFGMTAVPLIFRYPWYSVDSTSWVQATANGAIYLPAVAGGRFVFDRVPYTLPVSANSPKSSEGGKAGNSASPALKALMLKWLEVCGQTYDEVTGHYFHRAVCNAYYFRKVSEVKAVQPFNIKDQVKRASLWS